MNVEKFIRNEKTVAVITGTEKVLTDVQSALDLIMTAKYEVGTNLIAIEKSAVADDFFILSRGLAGEILEKFIPIKQNSPSSEIILTIQASR